jgi:class 3 adenylate cyclase
VTCAECGHENRAGRKFCAECGAGLALACNACGTPYDAGEKFCGECGASLGGAKRAPVGAADATGSATSSPPTRASIDSGARKIVTIIFADLIGSTTLHERLDAESAQRMMERYYDALRAVVDAHGGTVVKLLGDGVMAAFGLRQVAEDDALRAVHAAVAMQEAFHELASSHSVLAGAGLRVAVNTGEVVVSGGLDDVIGDPVNVAARLQEQARAGDVVVGESTRRLVATRVTLAPLGSVTLKGRAEAVGAYRVDSLEAPATAAAAPFVGRYEELTRLCAIYDAAIAGPAARLAVLLGSPGLGKSRLIDELGRRLGESVTLLSAHCDAAGGATFAPLATALRTLLGIEDAANLESMRTAVESALVSDDGVDRGRIAGGVAALLAGSPAAPEETFFVVRRLLAALARAKPVVLVIDDIHWAEPLLLDLVEHLIQWGSGVPLFVLVGARPELRDLRSSLVTPGGLVSDVVTLSGLDAGAAMRLAANVIGASDLPAAVAAKVLATSEGNPLFVGELVRMLVEEGALTKEGERWTAGAGLATIEMPPTIPALLAARIERLRPEERTVLERASVVGRHFSRSAVAALLGRNGSELDARLEALRRSELIERDSGWLLGEPALRFHHVLIRDAAYRRLLKETRAELHERLADWIEGQVGDAPEHDETIGWHLEQAHQHLREFGSVDARGRLLGERAAKRLAAAGRRALAGDDVPLAAGLLGRAIDRLDSDDDARAELALDWCEALLSAGDVGPAGSAISELERFAEKSERLRGWHTCFAGQLAVMTAPEELHAAAERVAAAASALAKLGDPAGEAKAHFVHAQALARLGKVGACEGALDQALAAARRAGDRRRANAVLAGAPLAALWGPSPVTRASGRCLDVVRVLRITQGAPAVEAVALSCQGVLEALRGRTDAARRMLTSSRTMVEELGITQRLFEVDVFIGRVDLLEGNAAAAERALRPAYEGFRDLGLGIDAARAAALLGRALLEQNRAAEAEEMSHESEMLAGDDLEAAIAWRGVRAEALAARGEHVAAVELAKAAVEIAAATDALLHHAAARVALAAALRAAGRVSEADLESRRATELWETKGATLLVERAGRAAAPIADAAPAESPRAPTPASPVPRRRVRPNAATAIVERDTALIEGGADILALTALFNDAFEEIDHPTGATYGRDAAIASITRLMRSRDVRYRTEPLATLGPRLMLGRRRIHASGTKGQRFDVGEYENEALSVHEVDGEGRHLRHEVFAADQLTEAICCLYARYAESLPEGAERERAKLVASTITAAGGSLSRADDMAAWCAPNIEMVDHRSISTWSARGAEAVAEQFRSLRDVADGVVIQDHDVLALEPHALLCRRIHSGTERLGGGVYEHAFLALRVMGLDGRITHFEFFDSDHEAEALARFDELAAGGARASAATGSHVRRIAPNAVTVQAAEFERIVGERDFDALESFFADAAVCIDHPTGTTYGAEGMRTGMRRLMQSPDARLRFVPLATLGPSWGIIRREMSASGATSGRFDVGPYEIVDVSVFGADGSGRLTYVEIFAPDRLRAAIARLYECYAQRLPEGPERNRASEIAKTVAAGAQSLDHPDQGGKRVAASAVSVDHRTLSAWSARGREEIAAQWRAQQNLADDLTVRDDEILALGPTAIAVRNTWRGVLRAGGGVFENVVICVIGYDADGLVERMDIFDSDREAEALARFDELAAAVAPKSAIQRRFRPNAATKLTEAIEAAFDRRDLEAVVALLGDPLETIEHPTGVTYGREGQIESSRRMMRLPDIKLRGETLATLGESLVLFRRIVTASGASGGRFDVGAYEIESYVLNEVDENGKLRRTEVFASDHLCQATGRLYARYAETMPEGAERAWFEGIARTHSVSHGSPAPEVVAGSVAPTYVCVDHRPLGTWSLRGKEELLQHWRGQLELATEFLRRDDDILAFAPGAHVLRQTYYGTSRASGGPFANDFISVNVFDANGFFERLEIFELGRVAEALARFDELTGGRTPSRAGRRVRANAASRSLERFRAALETRDGDTVATTFDESVEVVHHPTAAVYGRRELLTTWRSILKAAHLEFRGETLATLGDALALDRHTIVVEGFTEPHLADVGRMEHEEIAVIETDDAGRWLRVELFAAEHLDDAMIRLYEIHAARLPEGPARDRGTAAARARATHWRSAATDPDRFITSLAPAIVAVDHRTVGFGNLSGAEAVCAAVRTILDLSYDVTWRIDDILALSDHASLPRATQRGHLRAGGGEWERPICSLTVHDEQGLISRWEIFEPEHEAEALARYDELVGTVTPSVTPRATPAEHPFANAASRLGRRHAKRWRARDWDGFAAMLDPRFRLEDRQAMSRIELDREQYVAFSRELGDMDSRQLDPEILATRGEHLVLIRLRIDLAGGDVGPSEIAFLQLMEVNERGLIVGCVRWDLDDLDAAYTELDERWRASESPAHAHVVAYQLACGAALASRDWDALAALYAPTLVARDHRLVGWDVLEGPAAFVRAIKTLVEMAPDVRARSDHNRISHRGFIAELVWLGTRDGGAFESPYLWVAELDADGRGQCFDFYDPHHLDQAFARFEELCAPTSRQSPARAMPNAASAAMDRWQAAFDVGFDRDDWEAMRAVCAPGMTFDDRRRLALLSGDVDLMIASARERARMGAKPERQLRGTAGARVAIENILWSGGPADGRFEIEYVGVVEVDSAGLVTAMVMFDLDDLGAAKREAIARWTAIDPAAPAALTRMQDVMDAVCAQDWGRFRACLSDDLVVDDHRRTGAGRIEGADAYTDSVQAYWDLAPNQQAEAGLAWHAYAPYGGVTVFRCWGTLAEGGAFESEYLGLFQGTGERITRLEYFETEALDAALARFAELRPDPLRISADEAAASG